MDFTALVHPLYSPPPHLPHSCEWIDVKGGNVGCCQTLINITLENLN